ncbi:thymidine phosphorylase [Pseudodesulfovibrio cashew]|uniref:thymidine phosphorylase n=1 Tax=Pseudodesulfovibrio cashew TaxID=2678688 RepID=A0A6I6JEY3_9BACT|nr:thymidine phosphorylase [Pseudodesulfovibrio cashew]QGY41385.1 thymidine phosphorylase [Pseudodesulfovibrio cashew]
MLPQEVIRRKRDGHSLRREDLDSFIKGVTDSSITEGQVAAFAMAVFFRGMSPEETAWLTAAMAASGERLSWDLDGPVLDKHSTGGVGDLVSLVLGPMVAACGGYVPMISGRGLGHTGGTLDKLESIPGYEAMPGNDRFRRTVREAGVAIIGQTGSLAPADGRIYAIRDVTATVESIPLITASILSKKLAAGLEGLVMDVKTGNGAFMSEYERSVALAGSLVSVAGEAGLPTSALVTDMSEPLAPCAGNALEVAEAVRFLTGVRRDPRLAQVVMALCAEMLLLGGLAAERGEAEAMLHRVLDSGLAAEHFGRMVAGLGGPTDFIERWEAYLPAAPRQVAVAAPASGYVAGWETRRLGLAVVCQGGGRIRADQHVDHSVGLSDIVRVGTFVKKGDPLAVLHGEGEDVGEAVRAMVLEAVTLRPEVPEARDVIFDWQGEGA